MFETDRETKSVRVVLEGEMDAPTVEDIRPQLDELIGKGFERVTFDLGKTHFMCSAGLGMIVETYNTLASRGGSVIVEHLTSPVEKLLKSTRLLEILTAGEAPEEARLKALGAVQKHMSEEVLFLSYLSSLTSRILEADLSGDIYEMTLEGIVRSLKSSKGLLLLIDEGEDAPTLRLAASQDFDDATARSVDGLRIEEPSMEHVCLAAKQAQLVGTQADPGSPPSFLLERTGGREGILAPVTGRNEARGLILIEPSNGSTAFFPHAAPILQVFSNICGLALEKQALVEDIQYKNAQLSRTLSDLHKTQDTLAEAGKLAAVGSVVRGLAHTLNNKLVPIMGYSQMLLMQMQGNYLVEDKAAAIRKAAQDIKRVIDNVRTMTRREVLNVETHDIGEIIESALFMLDFMFRDERIRVEHAYGRIDATAQVDRERMMQAFLTLFRRLPAAMADVSERRVTIGMERGETELVVEIRDNGRPIPVHELDTILNPFAPGGGSHDEDRFNFSIVAGILKDHRGGLEVESEECEGTKAVLRIPLVAAPRRSPARG